jgi:threonine dehydrogenase-like Zn-dependent dehydrogenase
VVGACSDPEIAAELGIREAGTPRQAAPDAFSAMIEASGAESAVRSAPELCAPGGRIAQLGTPHAGIDRFPAATLVVKDATPHAVLSGIGYWADMLELVEMCLLRLEPLIDSVHSRFEVGAAFEQLSTSGRRRPKILLRMNAQ